MSVVSKQAKELLRFCKIEIPRLFTYNVLAGGYKILKNVSEAESYNGIFHRWVDGNSVNKWLNDLLAENYAD